MFYAKRAVKSSNPFVGLLLILLRKLAVFGTRVTDLVTNVHSFKN